MRQSWWARLRGPFDFASSVGFGAGTEDSGDDPGGDFWLSEGMLHSPRNHIAFRAKIHEEENTFYNVALANGAQCNG